MKSIHKQILEFRDEITIKVPKGALHLDIQMTPKGIAAWYLCDPEEKEETKITFCIVGTGFPLADNFQSNHYWIKTLMDNEYIWHIFLKDKDV